MSSANNNEHEELEQSMWRRFQDAEAMPDPEVWARIDHALTTQENAKFKKRALFYRQLAAACFILFVLAGSALMFHFKQDQEKAQLAAAKQLSTDLTATDTEISTETGDTRRGIVANNPTVAGNITAPEDNLQNTGAENPVILRETQQPSLAQASASDALSPVITKPERAGSTRNAYAASAAAIRESRNMLAGVSASEKKQQTTAQPTITGTLPENQASGYLPASQAIANVPDTYTSPSALNPLLRRNATIGTYTTEDKATENSNLQKQAELSLALNTPTEETKEEHTTAGNSRWNVGLGVTSSYFSQNVNIPEQRLMANQAFGFARQAGPIVSVETEQNLIAAYDEFRESTQAASSVNVEARTGFRVGKRLKLLTGLGYSQNTSKTRTSYIVEQFLFNPRSNERSKLQPSTVFVPSLHTFTTDSVSVVKVKEPFDVDYSYQMLSIPIGLQVEGNIGQKWFWYAMGTTAVNFLMQTTIKADNPEIADVSYGATDDSPFRKVQFSGNVGLGIGKRLNNAVSISAGPEFRTYFNSMLTDEKAVATQGRPYTIGLNVGVNYTLGQGN